MKRKRLVRIEMLLSILIVIGIYAGNYIQRNKYEVKEKIKNFVDKI